MINFNSFNKSAEDLEEASLKMKIAARGKAETELKKIGGEDAQMAAFLVNQGDMKELKKLMTKMPAATQSKIQSVLDKHLKEDCWDGYKQVGTKKKNGKQVPNCVPEESVKENAGMMRLGKRAKALKSQGKSLIMKPAKANMSKKFKDTVAAAAARNKEREKGNYKEEVELDETSPMIKDPEKRVFNDKKSAFVYKAKHGGKVQKRIYTDSRSGRQSISYQVVKEDPMSEGNQLDEVMSQKMLDKVRELSGGKRLSSAELRKFKKMAQDAIKKEKDTKKAEPPEKKEVGKTSTGKTRTGSADPSEKNIIMQLRKAQDVDGNTSIRVSPAGKSVKLNKSTIDKLLKQHDGLQKPKDKRMFTVNLIRALRKNEKLREETDLTEISAKMARRAAAASQAKAYTAGSGYQNPKQQKDADRLADKSDKATAHVAKRQGAKGVNRVNRMAGKMLGFEETDIDEASYKVPSNYAAMMAKKRKKAGTSEFGTHPDKKKEIKKEETDLDEKLETDGPNKLKNFDRNFSAAVKAKAGGGKASEYLTKKSLRSLPNVKI